MNLRAALPAFAVTLLCSAGLHALPGAVTPTGASLLGPVVDTLGSPDAQRPGQVSGVAKVNDARAVVVLRYIARHDRSWPAASRAVVGIEALAKSGREEAVRALGELAADVRPDVAEEAIAALGRLAPMDGAWDQLLRTARNDDLPQPRRRSAIATLRSRFPERARAASLPRLSGPTSIPILGGALTGGYAFSTLGRFNSDGAEVLGWLTGALVGGGTGFLFGREAPIDKQALYLSGLSWGIVGGELLARTVIEKPKHATAGAFGVGFEVAGFVAAWALEDTLALSASDVLFADVTGLSGLLFGYGVSELMFHKLGTRGRNGVVALSTLSWLSVAAAVAKRVELNPNRVSLQAFGAAEGWWYGMWLGDILHKNFNERQNEFFENADNQPQPGAPFKPIEFIDPDPDEFVRDASLGGMWVGAGLGYAAATVIGQHVTLSAGDVTQMFVFGAYGKLLGGGVASLGTKDGDRQMGASLALGAVGIGVGAMMAGDLSYNGGDVALVPIATAWGFFHGASVAAWMENRKKLKDDQFQGIVMTTGALWGVGALVATQQLQLTTLESTMATTGAFWGAWLSGWGASLYVKDGSDALLAAAIGGDVGAAVTALMISPVFEIDPLVLAGASFGGLSLAGVSSLIALMVSDNTGNPDNLTRVNLTGSVVGLALGGYLTSQGLDRKGMKTGKKARSASLELRENPDSSAFSWLRGVNAAPLLQQGQMTGMTFQLSGVW